MAMNGGRGRTKLPLVTHYIMTGWSIRHPDYPFHIVGNKDGRHYTVGVRRDQLDELIAKLNKAKDEYDTKYPSDTASIIETPTQNTMTE